MRQGLTGRGHGPSNTVVGHFLIRFELDEQNGETQVRFSHTGWPEANEHYRISCYCWAMYLRILKRFVEYGEVVPYEDRLEA